MQITVVLWTLAALSWLVIFFLLSKFEYESPSDIGMFLFGVQVTLGVGAWTVVYFVYRIARWASHQ